VSIDFDRRLGARSREARVQVDYAQMLIERGEPGDRERALRLPKEGLGAAHALGMQLVIEPAPALRLHAQGIDGSVTLRISDMEGFTRMTESRRREPALYKRRLPSAPAAAKALRRARAAGSALPATASSPHLHGTYLAPLEHAKGNACAHRSKARPEKD